MKRTGSFIWSFIILLVLSSVANITGSGSEDHHPFIEAMTTNDPISIDSDEELEQKASDEGWTGSGTAGDPYVIEDLSIDGDGGNLGLLVGNTTLHIDIQNISVEKVNGMRNGIDASGVALLNVSNITIKNSRSLNNKLGILVDDSQEVMIMNSNVTGNLNGIRVTSTSSHVRINGSLLSNNEYYGAQISGYDVNITNCIIIENDDGGIQISSIKNYNISENKILDNSLGGFGEGIRVTNYMAYNGRIENNTILHNGLSGLNMRTGAGLNEEGLRSYVKNNTIGNHSSVNAYCERFFIVRDNRIFNSSHGILSLYNSAVEENEVWNCTWGIEIQTDSHASKNEVYGNCLFGISVGGRNSLASTNHVHDLNGTGIIARYTNSDIENNLIQSCGENGIFVGADLCSVRYNVVADCGENGSVVFGKDHIFLQNIISDNENSGIYIDGAKNVQFLNDHIYENRGNGISGNAGGYVILDDVDIHDNFGSGLYLVDTGDITVRDSTFSYHGQRNILISSEGNITLDEVSTFASQTGAWLESKFNINVIRSSFFDLDSGFILHNCRHVRMRYNQFQNCGPYFTGFNHPGNFNYSKLDMDPTNLVNGRRAYLINASFSGDTVPQDAGFVIVHDRDFIEMRDLDLSDTTVGLIITSSTMPYVEGCSFENNVFSVIINNVTGFTFRSSTFMECQSGIWVDGTSVGEISRNSFIRGIFSYVIVENTASDVNISSNLFFDTEDITGFALWLSGSNCTIWENFFIYNRGTGDNNVSYLRQVYNDGNNTFHKNGRGNYWRDLHYPDRNGDGIVEGGYTMEGDGIGLDPYPLSRCPLFEPPTLEVTGSFDRNANVLSWSEPDLEGWSEIVEYRIYRRTYSGMFELLRTTGPQVLNYTDEDAKPGVDYRYTVTAVNGLLESDRSPEVRGLVDLFLPELWILEPAQGSVFGTNSVRVEWIGDDNQSGINHFEVRLDLNDWIDVGLTSTYSFFDLTQGTHIVKVKAVDNAGGEVIAQVQFLIDLGPPSVSIVDPFEDEFISENFTTVSFEGFDDLSAVDHYEYSLDGGNYTSIGPANSVRIRNLSEGLHRFEVLVFDLANNTAKDVVNFTVDSISPEALIISPYGGMVTGSRDVRIEWDGYDNGSGIFSYLFKLDDQEWIDVGLRMDRMLWQLEDGVHEVRILARDNAGNQKTVNVSFTVDGTPPELEIISPGDGSHVSQAPVNVQWNVKDPISGVSRMQFRDNESDWQDVETTSFSLFNLQEDTYKVWVRAYDNVDNFATTSVTFTVDRTPPRVIGFGPQGDKIELDEPVFVSFSEVMSQFDLKITLEDTAGRVVWKGDRAVYEPVGGLLEPARQYNVSVSGTDLAGNQLAQLEWTFNTTIYGKVRGRVLDEGGISVQEAKVRIGEKEVLTRPDGGFFIELENGTYELKISGDGYSTLKMDVNITAGRINELGEITLMEEDERRINIFAVLLVPAAIVLMVLLAAIGGTLINRRRLDIIEE